MNALEIWIHSHPQVIVKGTIGLLVPLCTLLLTQVQRSISRVLGNFSNFVLWMMVASGVSYLWVSWIQSLGLRQWGLFFQLEEQNIITLPLWAQIILGCIAIDLTSYWIHRLEHRIPWLWRLHSVHHSDRHMD